MRRTSPPSAASCCNDFRRAARRFFRPITSFRRHHGRRRSNSAGKAKGKAFQLDRDEQRVARHVAFLRRILGVKPKRAAPRQPGGKTFARQRSPPRPDHR